MIFALSLHIGATHIHICPTLVVYCLYSTPTSLYTYLCLSPHLGFILPRSLFARVCMETSVLQMSFYAADASILLLLCGFALRAYGSVYSALCHCGCACFLYAVRAGLATTYPVDGTPSVVRFCQCTMFILLVCSALRSLHTSPPHCLLLPVHLLPAYMRYSDWRDTHSIPCDLPIAATYYGGC